MWFRLSIRTCTMLSTSAPAGLRGHGRPRGLRRPIRDEDEVVVCDGFAVTVYVTRTISYVCSVIYDVELKRKEENMMNGKPVRGYNDVLAYTREYRQWLGISIHVYSVVNISSIRPQYRLRKLKHEYISFSRSRDWTLRWYGIAEAIWENLFYSYDIKRLSNLADMDTLFAYMQIHAISIWLTFDAFKFYLNIFIYVEILYLITSNFFGGMSNAAFHSIQCQVRPIWYFKNEFLVMGNVIP